MWETIDCAHEDVYRQQILHCNLCRNKFSLQNNSWYALLDFSLKENLPSQFSQDNIFRKEAIRKLDNIKCKGHFQLSFNKIGNINCIGHNQVCDKISKAYVIIVCPCNRIGNIKHLGHISINNRIGDIKCLGFTN